MKNELSQMAGEWRFLQLTVLLAAWMLVGPYTDRWIVDALLQLLLVNSVLVVLWANPGWRRARALAIGLWIVSLAGSAIALAPIAADWRRLARSVEILSVLPLLALLSVGILRFVFSQRRLTPDGIFATIVVYVLVALLFAQLYLLLIVWTPDSFNLPASAERPAHLLRIDLVYFSLVTLATLGYGDVLPLDETARTLAVIEAVVGQFFVAVIVAVFVGMFTAQRER